MKRKFREILVAPKGKVILAADLSQAETWIVAYLANEERMKFALQFGDIHAQTASLIYYPLKEEDHVWDKLPNSLYKCKNCRVEVTYEMRYLGKKCNHGTSYRMKAAQQARSINKESDQPPYLIVTEKQCDNYQSIWHGYYRIKDWWYEIENQLDRDRTLTTPYNRARTFYGGLSNQYERLETLKEATAYIPQSTVCDHFTGKVHHELGIEGGLKYIYYNLVKPHDDIELANMSHDSCALFVPPAIVNEVGELVRSYLLRPLVIKDEEFTIPVDVEVGDSYGSLEKLKLN